MKGILLISHGPLAQGMFETAEIFFGQNIAQFAYLTLAADEDPEIFRAHLKEAIKEVNAGDGVIIFADLFGGTPCNQCAFIADEAYQVITGMNLAMVMECLAQRVNDISLAKLMEAGKEGIVNYNMLLEAKKKARAKRVAIGKSE